MKNAPGAASRSVVTRRRRGVTLPELMVSLTIMAILMNLAIPRYRRTIEQAGVDSAGANLSLIWTAQRMHWIDSGTYAPDLATLVEEGLLDPASPPGSGEDPRFLYTIELADQEVFAAAATRRAGELWTGTLTINESGVLTGSVSDYGETSLQAYPN